jgi:aspartate racemase
MPEHIGLIGGIGPAATDYYYRRIISKFAAQGEHLDLTTVHADTPTLLQNLEKGDHRSQVEIYSRLTDRLASAGATCVVVTSIAGHFCIDAFKENSPLPVIDLIKTVDEAVRKRKLDRIGILGTLTVMESRFYSGLTDAEIVVPPADLIHEVHDCYISMAAAGKASEHERSVFDSTCEWFLNRASVEAVLLGGTDLALIYDEERAHFPVVDCAALHADAVVRYSIANIEHV